MMLGPNPFPHRPAHRERVYEVVDRERDYQDALPLERSDRTEKHVGEYLTLLRVYSARADQAWASAAGHWKALEEVRKIAAIAVHCLEVHGAPPRIVPPQPAPPAPKSWWRRRRDAVRDFWRL